IWFTEPGANKIGKLVLSTLPPDNLLTLSQTSLTFDAPASGSPPAPKTLTVTAPAAAPFTVSAFTQYNPWLSVSPSGNLTTDQSLSVSVNQASLGAIYGSYFGYILVKSGNTTQTVQVTVNVTRPPAGGDIKVSPTSLSFDYTTPQGSPPSPEQIVTTN